MWSKQKKKRFTDKHCNAKWDNGSAVDKNSALPNDKDHVWNVFHGKYRRYVQIFAHTQCDRRQWNVGYITKPRHVRIRVLWYVNIHMVWGTWRLAIDEMPIPCIYITTIFALSNTVFGRQREGLKLIVWPVSRMRKCTEFVHDLLYTTPPHFCQFVPLYINISIWIKNKKES